ncbi:MAG: hypothetical protein KA604_02290 [Candidatus Saccharimonas sp.]|nr:hypothetical protein [Candidatus Saccharimonas sp.]
MSDANFIKVDIDAIEAIREAKSWYTQLKESKNYGKAEYEKLLTKYGESIKLTEQLQADLAKAQLSKVPNGEEIDNTLKMLDSLDQMSAALPKLAQLQKQISKFNGGKLAS